MQNDIIGFSINLKGKIIDEKKYNIKKLIATKNKSHNTIKLFTVKMKLVQHIKPKYGKML